MVRSSVGHTGVQSREGRAGLACGTLCSPLFGRWGARESYAQHMDFLTRGSECWCCFGGVWQKEMKRTFNEVLVRAKHFTHLHLNQSARQVDTYIHFTDAETEAYRGVWRKTEPFSCAAVSASGPHVLPESSLLAGEEGTIIPFTQMVDLRLRDSPPSPARVPQGPSARRWRREHETPESGPSYPPPAPHDGTALGAALTSMRSMRSRRARTASSSSRMSAGESQGPSAMASRRGPASWRPRGRPLSQRPSLPVSSRMVSWSARMRASCCSAVWRSCSAVLCSSSSSSRSPGAASPCSAPDGQAAVSGVHRKRLKRGTGGSGCALAAGAPGSAGGPAEPPAPCSALRLRCEPGDAAAAPEAEALSAPPGSARAGLAARGTLAMMQMTAPRNASMPAASSTARNFSVRRAAGAPEAPGRRGGGVGARGPGAQGRAGPEREREEPEPERELLPRPLLPPL